MSHITPWHLADLHQASKKEAANSVYLYGLGSRYSRATNASQEPKIPAPELFESLTERRDGKEESRTLPTVGECAVHLELLEVFFTLRSNIIKSTQLDTAFGVKPDNKVVYRRAYDYRQRKYVSKAYKLQDKEFPKRRRKKWSYFLTLAVRRFRLWIKQMDLAMMADPALGKTDFGYELPHLPPLDVLMVWHAFLLNPLDYRQYCLKHYRKVHLCPFPRSRIHAAINARDWSYAPSPASETWARSTCPMPPDLLQYLETAHRRSQHVSTTLERFGAGHANILPPDNLARMTELPDADDSAFLALLSAVDTKSARADSPLADNVRRQASFVDKMHTQLWIRSPAVRGTLTRAVARYDNFLRLFKLYPGTMLVPTLDVDIVWHTHQCSAVRYKEDMLARAGRFVDHDDKIGRGSLDDGMAETKRLFVTRFGEEYEACLCWDCEGTKSALEEALDADGDGKWGEWDEARTDEIIGRVQRDVEYYRVVEQARRKGGGLLPVRP